MGHKEFSQTKGFYLVALMLVVFILHPLNLFAEDKQLEKTFKVEIKDKLSSVDVQDAELSEVLKKIENRTGTLISIGKELTGKKITAQFENLDIESALKEILRDNYYVLTFEQDPKNKEKRILKEVKAGGPIIGSKPLKGRLISLDIPYGNGKGEVGAIKGEEGSSVGPPSFAVDNAGNIYILDTVNNRVQICSTDGKYQSTVLLQKDTFASDIAVDKYGSIYIYDRSVRKLYQYEKNGNIVTSIDIDESRWGGGGTMHIIDNEIYIYACDSNTCGDFIVGRTLFDNLLVGSSVEETKRFKEKGKGGLSGKKYMTGLKGFEKGELEIKEKDSPISKRMSFPLSRIFSIGYLGEDKKGNVYLETIQNDENKDIAVEVHKFDVDNDYHGTITMPKSHVFIAPIKDYFVSQEGVVYRFRPEENKLRLQIFFTEGN